jgi:hypothetical protein
MKKMYEKRVLHSYQQYDPDLTQWQIPASISTQGILKDLPVDRPTPHSTPAGTTVSTPVSHSLQKGRWNFDGFAKIEALVVSNVDRYRAMLPRLMAVEKRLEHGNENE